MTLLAKTMISLVVLSMGPVFDLAAQTPAMGAAQTTINGRPVSQEQRYAFQLAYGVPLQPGNFWYDSRSGMWGYWGREVAGLLKPGHDFGPLPANASNGNTGIFINGRQLNTAEVIFFQNLLGVPMQPGRAWLDGVTGNIGLEGNPIPLVNLVSLVQARQPKQRQPLWSGSELMGGFSNPGGTCTKSGNCFYPGQ